MVSLYDKVYGCLAASRTGIPAVRSAGRYSFR